PAALTLPPPLLPCYRAHRDLHSFPTRRSSDLPEAKDAMEAAAGWVNSLRRIGRPVFLAAPAVWDGMFVHWYFMRFLGKSPFGQTDRKSTRLNSSHVKISYAVFCLKKKKKQ